MLAAAGSGAAEGDWLIADRQSAGRGRMGRQWASPVGNGHASGLVRLRKSDRDAATLALVAAIAVFDTVAIFGGAAQLMLKWPNDLLGGGAKLAGILLERAGDAVVVGVGVNLIDAPAGLARRVTSLAALGTVPPEPAVFVERLAEVFAGWIARWRHEGLACVRAAWLERAHETGTALVANLPDGEAVEGVFAGLTEDCALRLRLADGAVRVIHAGDVFLI